MTFTQFQVRCGRCKRQQTFEGPSCFAADQTRVGTFDPEWCAMTLPLFTAEQQERTRDDLLTPRWVFDALGLKFDLDVASPPWATHVPAREFYTKAEDGLAAPWFGRVWMNPPYSQATPWVLKFIEHGHGIALVPWAKAAWTIKLWNAADGIALPPIRFDFDGESGIQMIPFMTMFAAFGAECVEAIANLSRVR